MANQDVQVNEVDVIKAYNPKFGEFFVSFSEHLRQLQHALQEKLEEFQQIKQDIKREREKIDEEIRQARQKAQDAYNYGSYETYYNSDGSSYTEFKPDYDYIRQCREEYEHLSGSVYHNAKTCEEYAHGRLLQATQIVNIVEQRTNSLNSSFQNYVERGRQYLDKVAQYIDQYKEKNPSA
jgi:transcription termination factor NusB